VDRDPSWAGDHDLLEAGGGSFDELAAWYVALDEGDQVGLTEHQR
jgi:hypothetical protein